RPELRWSDGVPITAQDYVISYGLQVNPETGAAGPERWTVGDALITVEASDTHSLVVRIPTFDRLAVQTVASHYPLPDHVFGHAYRTGGAEAVTTLWGTGTPPSELVFSGAMVVGEVREGERMTLARNPYFGEWNVDAAGRPLPYLDGMTFTYMEPFAQLNSFLAGDLDFFQARDIDELGVISTAVSNDGLDAVVYESVFPVEATYFFAFNLNLASDPFKQDLFRSPEFRRAVAHLVDRSSLVDLVYAGAGFPLRGSIPPTYAPWFDEDLDILEFDPEAAVGLLEGLGFTGRDSDGVLIDAHGRRAGFTIIVPDAAEAE